MDFQYFAQSGLKPIVITPFGFEASNVARPITIPKSCTFIYALLIGCGGNGGNGFGRAASANGGGGGGGGSGGTGRLFCPANIFNTQMYVRVPFGGSIGITGIWLYPQSGSVATASALLQIGGAANGGNGTGTAAGAAGGSGSAGTGLYPALTLSVVGAAGGAGGFVATTGAVGATATSAAMPITMQGAGGGGIGTSNVDIAGGAVTLTGNPIFTLPGGLAAGGAGQNGVVLSPWNQGTGGSGGGTNNAGVGGAGGIALAPGCGGGGGGAGLTTGGAGGRGGDGQIQVWFI
jgi:hypothetical protein